MFLSQFALLAFFLLYTTTKVKAGGLLYCCEPVALAPTNQAPSVREVITTQ